MALKKITGVNKTELLLALIEISSIYIAYDMWLCAGVGFWLRVGFGIFFRPFPAIVDGTLNVGSFEVLRYV